MQCATINSKSAVHMKKRVYETYNVFNRIFKPLVMNQSPACGIETLISLVPLKPFKETVV